MEIAIPVILIGSVIVLSCCLPLFATDWGLCLRGKIGLTDVVIRNGKVYQVTPYRNKRTGEVEVFLYGNKLYHENAEWFPIYVNSKEFKEFCRGKID